MADYNSSLPVRSEVDVDERVQIKIVDYTTPTQGTVVDTDGNVHVEMHGHKPDGTTDVVLRLSELGDPNPQGDYDVTNNSKPGSVGFVAHDRGATINETSQNKRVTAVAGESDSVCVDVALHDFDGNKFDAAKGSTPIGKNWINGTIRASPVSIKCGGTTTNWNCACFSK